MALEKITFRRKLEEHMVEFSIFFYSEKLFLGRLHKSPFIQLIVFQIKVSVSMDIAKI
jgi:hypothetical protein